MRHKMFKVITLSALLAVTTGTSAVLTSGNPVNADSNIQAYTKNEGVQNIDKDSKIFERTATASDTKKHITQSLQFNFIKDESYDKETVVLKAAGNIASGARILDPNAINTSTKRWPGEYKVSVALPTTDSTAIIDYAPRNSDESREVSDTVGVEIGAGLNIKEGGDGNANAKYSFQETIKYKQDSYRTFLEAPTHPKAITWGVEAYNINVDGAGPYSREKFNDYRTQNGNELFLKNKTSHENAGKNFTDPSRLPSLISNSFNPEFITVFSHDYDDKDKTKVKVTYEREMDDFVITWKKFFWGAYNNKDVAKETMTVTYEIDWENHDVKFVKAE